MASAAVSWQKLGLGTQPMRCPCLAVGPVIPHVSGCKLALEISVGGVLHTEDSSKIPIMPT